ncbi:MAG: tRNA (adenosine(37)-N6)-threonylcarbamoyltransferase complex transferase subunit TsaD, partial [Alphaproteobacteria bacterium]
GLSKIQGFSYFAPPPWLCTDNGVMIAWAGIEKFKLNKGDPLDTSVRARWPLDETASPVIGHGRRGVKV